jgi:cytoskeleton protein RodZ
VLFGGAIFALLSYGVWYVNSTRDGVVAEFVTSVPDRLGQLMSPGDEAGEAAKPEDGNIGSEDSTGSSPRLAVAATDSSDQPGEVLQGDAASRPVEPVSESVRRRPFEEEAAEETMARSNAAPDARTPEAMPAPTPGPSTDGSRAPTTLPGTGTAGDSVVAAVEPGSGPGPGPEGGGRTGTSFGDPEEARIVLKATAESWIQVRDETNDRVLLARLLRPGDVYRVPNRSGLNLWTGNAGGLEILVDGEPVPSIGETGVVRRRVVLEVEPLRTGAAVR